MTERPDLTTAEMIAWCDAGAAWLDMRRENGERNGASADLIEIYASEGRIVRAIAERLRRLEEGR